MITKEIALAIHDDQIAGYGGMPGIRDEGLLESALNRAYPTWGDQDLRPDPLEKAAALLEGIVGNPRFSTATSAPATPLPEFNCFVRA